MCRIDLVEGGRVGSVCFAVFLRRALRQLRHLTQDLLGNTTGGSEILQKKEDVFQDFLTFI